MNLSSNMEDYLEAIFEIRKERQTVRVRDVAHKLGVTMPSVNGALKNLVTLGLIRHSKYEYIELTRSGSMQASRISARHQTILLFLTEIIGVDAETAETEACRMEHVLSTDTMEKLAEYIKKRMSERPEPVNHELSAVLNSWNENCKDG